MFWLNINEQSGVWMKLYILEFGDLCCSLVIVGIVKPYRLCGYQRLDKGQPSTLYRFSDKSHWVCCSFQMFNTFYITAWCIWTYSVLFRFNMVEYAVRLIWNYPIPYATLVSTVCWTCSLMWTYHSLYLHQSCSRKTFRPCDSCISHASIWKISGK